MSGPIASTGNLTTANGLAKAWLDLPEQTAAITHTGSPLLILAGAGSGKTTVMARRMAFLIREQGWEPEQILGLTFSNKAAANLRARAISELGPGSNVSVQTYHGFGASIVQSNYARLGFDQNPRLIDRAEAWQLLYGALDSVTINHRKTGRLGSLINEALALASSCADHLVTIEAVVANCEQLLGPDGPRLADNAKRALQYRLDLCRLATAYAEAKRSYACIDFSDQLALGAKAVSNFDDIAQALRTQYPVVLLDEYQDTNFAQRKLLELLYVHSSTPQNPSLAANVTAVGDDMQSIYGFRGAHLSNITNFEQHMPGATERRLETNHRSGAEIVSLANYVQAQVPSARPKTLRAREDAYPAKLTSFIGADDSAEAAEIAKRCLAIGGPWAEIAVLCRKRKVIPAIVAALKAAGIPVDVMGMGGLLARPEVIDLLAWLEIICAPTDSNAGNVGGSEAGSEIDTGTEIDTGFGMLVNLEARESTWIGPDPSIALLRILQGPRFRIGMRDLGALGRSARKLARKLASERPKDGVGDDRRVDLMAAIVQTDSVTELSAEAYVRCKQFVHIRSTLRDLLDRSVTERSIADVIDSVAIEVGLYSDVDATGYENLLRFIDVASRFSPLSSRARTIKTSDNVDPLYQEPVNLRAPMLEFLEYLQLVAESEDDPAEATQTGADAVQIMSIHQAKGLEFDTVFLAGIAGTKKTSSIFPDERLPANGVTQAAVLPPWLQADGDPSIPPISNYKELKVLADAARQRSTEEELRLLYVALTRARKNLICSTGHWYPGPQTPHGPSTFFDLLRTSGLMPLAKSEPAATEDPAVSLRRRRLDELNEKLDRRARLIARGDSGSSVRSVETGLFGEPLPSSAGRSKSRRLKPPPAPLADPRWPGRGQSADGGLSSEPAFIVTALPVSALGVVSVCPRKYHWTYVVPLPRRRSPAAEFGTAVHSWIESTNRGDNTAFPILEDRNVDTQSLIVDRYSTELGGGTRSTRVQQNFLASRFGALTPFLNESAFTFSPNVSPQTALLAGRIDAAYRHSDGMVEIVDFKSGRAPYSIDVLSNASNDGALRTDTAIHPTHAMKNRIDWPESEVQRDENSITVPLNMATTQPVDLPTNLPLETALQLAAYGLLALDVWGVKPYELRTTVCYLGGDSPVLHTTQWSPEIEQTHRGLVGTHIIKILRGSSGVVPGQACTYCDFNAFCEGASSFVKTQTSTT